MPGTMKKLFTIILVTAVLLTACTIENSPIVDHIVTINATIAGNTKVALGSEDEKKVNWTENDIINLTINGAEYPFTWQEGTTFAYTGGKTLPILTQGMQITGAYASAFNTAQTGLKADVGNYMALSAKKTISTMQSYGDLNLTFSHGTSILKLTLSNEDFKGKEVTNIILKANNEVIAGATATFMGDAENGSVTIYLAIKPSSLENVTIHATCASKEYTAIMTDKSLTSGKLYNAYMEVAISNDYIDEYCINHGKGVEIDGVIWAPVNCGYHATDFKYGKLYQWGRKYGQGYNGQIYNEEGSYIGEYSDSIIPERINGPVDLATGQSKDNDAIFYYMNHSTDDWCRGAYHERWNSGSEAKPIKTEYDPCPEGWRVPTESELNALRKNRSEWTTEMGQVGKWFSGLSSYSENVSRVFLPAAGHIKKYDGYAIYRGAEAYYWSSRRYSYSDAYAHTFNNSDLFMEITSRANGFSVRCVQE